MSDKELLAQIGMTEEEAEARAQASSWPPVDCQRRGQAFYREVSRIAHGLCGRSGKGAWPHSVGGAATHRGGGKEPRIGITVCSMNRIRHR